MVAHVRPTPLSYSHHFVERSARGPRQALVVAFDESPDDLARADLSLEEMICLLSHAPTTGAWLPRPMAGRYRSQSGKKVCADGLAQGPGCT